MEGRNKGSAKVPSPLPLAALSANEELTGVRGVAKLADSAVGCDVVVPLAGEGGVVLGQRDVEVRWVGGDQGQRGRG
jgi:hypothetical protein